MSSADETAISAGIEAAVSAEAMARDEAIAQAQLASQKWLPSVQTNAALPDPASLSRDITYLCRVRSDPTAGNNGVWQLAADAAEWAYYSDNLDFVDETELAAALGGKQDKIPAKTADAPKYLTEPETAGGTPGTATPYADTIPLSAGIPASIYDTVMFSKYVAATIADMPNFLAWTGIVDSRSQDFSPDEYRGLTAKNMPENNRRGGIFTEFKSGRAIGATAGTDANLGLLTTAVPWGDAAGGVIQQVFELKMPGYLGYKWERASSGAQGSEVWSDWIETSNMWKPVTFTKNTAYVSTGGTETLMYNPSVKTLYMTLRMLSVKPRTWSRLSLIPVGNITMPFASSIVSTQPDRTLFDVEARKSGTLMERQTLPIELYPAGEFKLYFPPGVFTDDTTNLEIRGTGSFVLY